MKESLLVQIVIRQVREERDSPWTVELFIGGAEVPTGIEARSSVAAARMLAARLAGTAP